MAKKTSKGTEPGKSFDDATLDVGADGALAVLAKVPEGDHEALVAAWVARKNAAAVAEIARLDDAPSVARKAARRALSVLRSRGIAVPERSNVVSLVSRPTWSLEARCLFPDGQGAQVWWIAKISSTGATEVVEVTTVDWVGLVELNRGNPSAGNLRQMWQGWAGRAGRAPMQVPVEWARARIAAARKLAEDNKRVLPMGLDACHDLLSSSDGALAKHPIDAEELALPTDEAAVKARIGNSMHLHTEPEFGAWLPDDRAGVAFLQSIDEKVNALRVDGKDPEQDKIDEAVRELIDSASDAYFNEERKKLYVGRLRDAAFSLWSAGKVGHAADALLVADAISKAGVISDRPSEIPFVRGLFLKLIAVAQQRAQQAQAQAAQG